MSRELRILTRAHADIDRIFTWLKKRSSKGAANWILALFHAVGRITQSPTEFAPAIESKPTWGHDIRQHLFKTRRGKTYRIVFEVNESEILIRRIRGPGQPPLRRSGFGDDI